MGTPMLAAVGRRVSEKEAGRWPLGTGGLSHVLKSAGDVTVRRGELAPP